MPDQGSHSGQVADVGQSRAAVGRRVDHVSPEDHLAAIVDSSDDAIISKSPTGEILSWNPAAQRLYGYEADEIVGRPIRTLIPPHRAREEEAILARILAGDRLRHYETERLRKDGEMVTVSLTVSPVHDATGAVVAASVIARDITQQKRAQERADVRRAITAALSEAISPQAVVELALEKLLPALSAAAATVAMVSDDGEALELVGRRGYSEEDLSGWDRFPLAADLPLSDAVRAREPVWVGSPEALLARYPALAGSEMRFDSLAAVPLVVEGRAVGGLALSFQRARPFSPDDKSFILTVAQQIGESLERGRLYDREQRARAEVERAHERLAFLSRASEILAQSLELDDILQRVADVAVPRIADWCGVDLVDEGGSTRQVAVAHVDPAKVELARDLRRRYPSEPDAATGVPAVIRTGRPEVYPEVSDEMIVESAESEEHLQLIRALGLVSIMIVPLSARGRTLGAITFVSSQSGHRYGEADLALAEDLARRAALAVDNSLLYGEEREVAVTLQRSLLPRALPGTAGIELAARYLPAGRGIEVGGDWYDAVQLGQELVVVVGDVAGRGIKAASVMGQLRNALRAYAIEGRPPAQAVERLNRFATASESADMATLLYLVVNPAAGRLDYVRAGHPPALVRRPDGTVVRLDGAGSPPVGVLPSAVYHSQREPLLPGSLLLLYTDGLVERRDTPIQERLQRLEGAFRDSPRELEECCDFVLESLGVDDRATDDTALLALGVRAAGRGESAQLDARVAQPYLP